LLVFAENVEDIEILTSLGLSVAEAKVFFTLFKIGESTVGNLSKESGVARELVYRLLPKLKKRGLVEEIISKPKKFKAIPLKMAYEILLRRKEEENKRLYSKAMLHAKKHTHSAPLKVTSDHRMILIPSRGAPDVRIGQEFRYVQKSLDLTFPVGKFIQWSRYYANSSLKKIIKKNVKMRVITQCKLPKLMKTYPKIFTANFKSRLKHLNFRCFQEQFLVEMMIFDKETLFVSTTKEININKMVWFRTNNPLMLEMAKGYFEALWEKAADCKI
jgi:sugar-specific transcriptional regulator TrmB